MGFSSPVFSVVAGGEGEGSNKTVFNLKIVTYHQSRLQQQQHDIEPAAEQRRQRRPEARAHLRRQCRERRIAGRRPWAVLGFECAARTYPFLGSASTRDEHRTLRSAVAPDSPWLGMMAWGEIGPCLGEPAFHNYSYPLVTFLAEAA